MWLQQKIEIKVGPVETNYSGSSNKISTAVRESRSGFCSEMQLCSNLLLLASPRQHQFNSTDCTKRRISSLRWIIVAIKGRAENSKWWQRWSFSRDIKSLAGRRQVHLPCNPKIESLYHFWERLGMTALWGRVMHSQKKYIETSGTWLQYFLAFGLFFECSQFNYTNVWWFLKCVCKIHNCIGIFFHVWLSARKIQEFWPNAEGQASKLRNLSFQFGTRRVIVLPMKNAAVLWL